VAEALDLPWGADGVGARARRAGHDDARRGALTNAWEKATAIERGQPERAEREAEKHEKRRSRDETESQLPAWPNRNGKHESADRRNGNTDPQRVGQRQTKAERCDETVLKR
jgi:hypothetical protein